MNQRCHSVPSLPKVVTCLFFVVTVAVFAPRVAVSQQSKIDQMDPLSKLFMFPQSEQFATPSDLGLDADPVEFENVEGHLLRGYFVKTKDATRTIMVCPGNAANISVFLPYAKIFADGGYNVFLFDYQGYGLSDGVPGFTTLMTDAISAYKFVTEQKAVTPENLGVFGVSLGSTISIYLAARHPIGALAVEDTFVPSRMLDLFEESQEPGAFVKAMLNTVRKTIVPQVDPIANVPKVKCPIFFLHGENDTFLPPVSTQHVRNAATCPTRVWIMKDAGHAPETLEVNDREFACQLQLFFDDAFAGDIVKDEIKLEWKTETLAEETETLAEKYKTTVTFSVNAPRCIELSLMSEDNRTVVVRQHVTSASSADIETGFLPAFVTAIECKHVKEIQGQTWTPDLSELSQHRADFVANVSAIRRIRYDFRRETKDNKDRSKTDDMWQRSKHLVPIADQLHPHIRPYYTQWISVFAFAARDADYETQLKIWERLLTYFPEQNKTYYRLGNAWFRLGFRCPGSSRELARWAEAEFDRGNIDKARELLRLHLEVSHPSWTKLKVEMIDNMQDAKQLRNILDGKMAIPKG